MNAAKLRWKSEPALARVSVYLTFLTYGYLLITLLFLILRLVARDFWPVMLWANCMPIWLLLAMGLSLVLLRKRQWIGLLLVIPAIVSFGIQYGRYFLPHMTDTHGSNTATVEVMTFNLGSDLAEATQERVEQIIRNSGAMIVAVQEVNAGHAQMFEDTLSDQYPYQIVYAAGEGTLGIALLSRYPIVSEEAFYGELGFLPYINAVLDVDGHEIRVLNVHPAPPEFTRDPRHIFRTRGLQDAELFGRMADSGRPTLVLGDLNSTDQSQEYAILAESSLRDAFYEKGNGFGFTYPVNHPYGYTRLPSIPLFRIDYVWYTEHFGVLDAWVGENAGSDHLPVLATLVLLSD